MEDLTQEQLAELEVYMQEKENATSLVIYCSRCEMWFDTKNGWKAAKGGQFGIPLCPACHAPLFEIPSQRFFKNNEHRLSIIETWEWPNGSLWKKRRDVL